MLEQFLEKNTINELVIYEFPFINSDWKAAHHNAAISLENREEKLDEVYNQIERNLDLLGATAIEDKLQVWDIPCIARVMVRITLSGGVSNVSLMCL